MAKVSLGPVVGQASGAIGGAVFSHNRYGPYIRRRATPTNPNTNHQQAVRARLAQSSTAWQALTAAQRAAWTAWAQVNPVVGSLGLAQILTGHTAFVQIGARMGKAGFDPLDDPPVLPAPEPLNTLSLTPDIGVGDFDLVFATTPLGAEDRLWINAAVVDSAGINYVQNLLKLVTLSPKGQASPYDIETYVEARFGQLQVGQIVHIQVGVFNNLTGLLATPLKYRATVIETV